MDRKAREKARTVSCISNLKQLGLGCAMYQSDTHNNYVHTVFSFQPVPTD